MIFFIFFCLSTKVFATPVLLTLESYAPASFPIVNKIIDVPEITDQLEISKQAALFALSSDGWNLENLGLDGFLQYREPPQWTGRFYFVDIKVSVPVAQEIEDLFGYILTETNSKNGPGYSLFFHTDELVSRLSHNIGESANNYGVISGGMDGDFWHQCPVPDWGRFYIETIEPVSEPATMLLLGTGLVGLTIIIGRRKKEFVDREMALSWGNSALPFYGVFMNLQSMPFP